MSFTLDVGALGRRGTDLARPENVLAFRDGTVFASSNRGDVTRIDSDGRQWRIGNLPGGQPATMALDGDDALLVNDTGDGNVYRLYLDGRHELVLDRIDGVPLGSANHVFRDRRGRTWVVVATRRRPPHDALHVAPDGYIALIDEGGPRIVADGLCWPNEIRLDEHEQHAFVSESLAGRIVRYRVTADGMLVDREVVGPPTLGPGAIPDGLALDAEGNVWVAVVSRNALVILTADGAQHTVFEQPVPEAVAAMAAAHASGRIPRPLLTACAGPDLRLLSSIGFAGPDLRTVVMGSLAMSELVQLRSPVPGLALAHQHRASAPAQPEAVDHGR